VPDLLISARQVITPAQVHAPGWVHVVDRKVAAVGAGTPPRPADLDLPAATIVPGFVDVHVHGGGGASFDGGDQSAAQSVLQAHLSRGTTTMMASLVSAEPTVLTRSVKELAALAEDGLLAGVHLEGPWLSPRHAGAHDPALLALPNAETIDRLVEVGDGHLRMVTLAPELPGGLDAVRRLAANGVVVAVGHTDATYDEARAAIDAGASVGTHLFNAMRGLHHREPGPVVALIERPDTYVELIADGVHLHPAVLRMAAQSKPERTVLVTDAMAAAAAGDGDYRLGDLAVSVRNGVARLADSGAIAGSTLTIGAAVRYAVGVAGLSLTDTIRAATLTPAVMLGLDRVGALEPGFHADLVVLDADLDVVRVMRRGAWV